MPRFIKKRSKKAGLAPGTLVHIGDHKTEKIKITLIDYDEVQLQEKELKKIEESFPLKEKKSVTWINIDGIYQLDVIEKLGKHFGIHPLIQEDIVNTGQRPKAEDFDDYVYIVLKMLYQDKDKLQVKSEQISLIIGKNFLISFQEVEGDVFSSVRDRLRKGKGRIRKMGCDYLTYALMDAIVDNYFIILETIGEKIEALEEELLENPTPQTLQTIHAIKREMIFFRKQVWPIREIISGIIKFDSPLINESIDIYFKDIHDHTIQVIDTIESFRDLLSSMVDIYLSTISNKMNEVMKVLTIIATIFIPLTFVAGIYGMNFKYMPELEWQWGYPLAWLIFVAITISMICYFKRKSWL
ncbi:MAG: magnesium/cobalt transporter CorA [Proteobacteria bacterium]|nr:magnesium/cobalt transporter CorA [Desulfobacteraceae bacterium]MBU4012020.1 magnesium/cobalt transporter CorA [Pseudomonadota bacterium]MBU4069315.1 magnesium/cobalt transporter CorA [Pseudomonadota bacterium]MBU4100902.1 magnesium/cobalt transporter CorA [Pseudomonadota bacterium]MBU4126987.1 magnesium/cobalt transporter CorA [Pseudomonadota bacterium]